MQTLRIFDYRPSQRIVVDPRDVFALLGERAIRATWQVAEVARYDEPLIVVGKEAVNRLEELSRSHSRVSGTLFGELITKVVQIIWGEFTAFEEEDVEPWVILRAIDSSFCEVETDDQQILQSVRKNFLDVR